MRNQYSHLPMPERFWAQVNKNGPLPLGRPELGVCWIWTSGPKRQPVFAIRGGRTASRGKIVSRWAWEDAYGPIEDRKLFVCHHCDNPRCVRLSHLYLGNHRTNTLDAIERHRFQQGGNHYTHRNPELRQKGENHGGHRLTDEQVYAIRARLASGETLTELAIDFGVGRAAISKIKTQKRWKHLL